MAESEYETMFSCLNMKPLDEEKLRALKTDAVTDAHSAMMCGRAARRHNMKLRNIDEVNAFVDAIENCKKDVYLIDRNGDKLNLKSAICRYVGIGKLVSGEGSGLELFCDSRDDEQIFFRFFGSYPEVIAC